MTSVADICCGLGGVATAFRLAGYRVAWACDLDPVAREVYAANHGVAPLGDLWDVDPDEVPEADVVAGGTPCQPFSSMGRHRCWSDRRANVLVPLMRLLCRRRPKVVMVENVEGLTHRKKGQGRPLDLLLAALSSCGYAVSHAVLNAAKFGAAQHRPRVFVVGDRGGRPFDFARLERRPAGRYGDVLEPRVPAGSWHDPSRYVLLDPPFRPSPSGVILAAYRPGRLREGRPGDVGTLSSHQHAARVYHPDGLCPTVMSRSGLGLFRVGDRIREPTVLEVQRLMGLPDSYLWPCGETRRRLLLGQSVHVPTVEAVARGIAEQLL